MKKVDVRKAFLLILIYFLNSFSLQAQSVRGNLEGIILDSDGHPIRDVNVSAFSPSLQKTRGAATNSDGYFIIPALPVGRYQISIHHIAHQERVVENVSVRLGKTTSIGEQKLTSKTIESPEVFVYAKRPLLDPSSSSLGENLETELFELLPVQRDFRSVVSMLPLANTSYLGDETNIAGATGVESMYFIDGNNTTDPFRGLTSTNLPYNFVKEIEVKQGGYEAEFGKAMGGIINVVTHSGSNTFHSNVFAYLTGSRFASNPQTGISNTNVESFSTYDVGISLSGPIIRDKLWYFAAYNPSFESQDIEIPGFGIHGDKKTSHRFAGKLTYQFQDHTQVTLTAIGDPTTHHRIGPAEFIAGTSFILADPYPYLFFMKTGSVDASLQWKSVFKKNILIEGAISYLDRDENVKGNTGTSLNEPHYRDLTNGTISGGVGNFYETKSTRASAWMHGTFFFRNHQIKTGLCYENNKLDDFYNLSPYHLTKVNTSHYIKFVWNQEEIVSNKVFSWFLQDSWLASRRMRLNLGLRWESQFLFGDDGKLAQPFTNQIQPRVGFAYQVGPLGTQKLFGSIGRFYQQLGTVISALYFTGFDVYQEYYSADPRTNSGIAPDSLIVWATKEKHPFSRIPDLQGEHYDELTIGYERLVGKHYKVGITGIYRTLKNAIQQAYDLERQKAVAGNPGSGELSFLPKFTRDFTAFELTFSRFGADRVNFMLSYVLSRNYGNFTGLFNSDINASWPGNYVSLRTQEQAKNSTGLLPNDHTHVFKLLASYRFDNGLTAGMFFTAQNGMPLNEFGASLYDPGEPVFLVKRGSAGRTPAIWDLNVRLTYRFNSNTSGAISPKIILDFQHIGNPRGIVNVNQWRYLGRDSDGNHINPNPTFGQTIAHQSPFMVRLGLEVDF